MRYAAKTVALLGAWLCCQEAPPLVAGEVEREQVRNAAEECGNAPERSKPRSAAVVEFYGYPDCIRLENGKTRVTLCPRAGGRVLEYCLNNRNALYLPPGDEGWEEGAGTAAMNAGRFDIGPEQTIPRHDKLWSGRWTGEITGERAARLVSQPDESSGAQLTREFTLDESTSRLECKQTIRNISNTTREYCHWGRTFALGGGICVIPLTEPSRFPNGYVMYEGISQINIRPTDPQIRKQDGFLVISGAPRQPKLGMDTSAGWFAYLMKNDLMFVKRFPVYPERPYNEVAALTMSVWYPNRPMCELEPIGPRERIEPGQSASFTETWHLLAHPFPKGDTPLAPRSIAELVEEKAR